MFALGVIYEKTIFALFCGVVHGACIGRDANKDSGIA
jgi:hypothetical protein